MLLSLLSSRSLRMNSSTEIKDAKDKHVQIFASCFQGTIIASPLPLPDELKFMGKQVVLIDFNLDNKTKEQVIFIGNLLYFNIETFDLIFKLKFDKMDIKEQTRYRLLLSHATIRWILDAKKKMVSKLSDEIEQVLCNYCQFHSNKLPAEFRFLL